MRRERACREEGQDNKTILLNDQLFCYSELGNRTTEEKITQKSKHLCKMYEGCRTHNLFLVLIQHHMVLLKHLQCKSTEGWVPRTKWKASWRSAYFLMAKKGS